MVFLKLLAWLERVSIETETIGYKERYVRGDLLGELTHKTTRAEKSHHMVPASWKTREAGGIA